MHIRTAAAEHADSLVLAQLPVGTEVERSYTGTIISKKMIRNGAVAGL